MTWAALILAAAEIGKWMRKRGPRRNENMLKRFQ